MSHMSHDQSLTEEAHPGVDEFSRLQKRLSALETVAAISQAVGAETELEALYAELYNQITHVMGEVDFIVALYDASQDMIEIPYARERGKTLEIAPFPRGEGLTSILLRSGKPLLLVENVPQQAQELGAKLYGETARSWLGVPLLVGDEAIGALILQDIEREGRFSADDQRLLSALANQIAVSIRHVQLLTETRRKAEEERLIAALTTKLWAHTEIEGLLRTTLQELGRTLGAASGTIRLSTPQGGDPE